MIMIIERKNKEISYKVSNKYQAERIGTDLRNALSKRADIIELVTEDLIGEFGVIVRVIYRYREGETEYTDYQLQKIIDHGYIT